MGRFLSDIKQTDLEGGRIEKLLSPARRLGYIDRVRSQSRFQSDGFVAFWASTGPHSVGCQTGVLTKNTWSLMHISIRL